MKSLMFITGAAVFAAALATGAPASAGPRVIPVPGDPDMMQTTVVLGDLDLERNAGAQTAATRIRRAAKAVCATDVGPYPLGLQVAARACTRASLREALERLDRPMVTRAAYGEKAPTVYAAR